MVLGVSFDTPQENKAFADEQGFNFDLLSDVDRRTGERYGVVREPDDQYVAFPLRISFLIGPDGTIRRVYRVTDVATHADDVLADLAVLRS